MKTLLLSSIATASALLLSSCSWMSQSSCTGTQADQSNPVCASEMTQSYRESEQRWFCVGLEAGEAWSCGRSLSKAQANRSHKKVQLSAFDAKSQPINIPPSSATGALSQTKSPQVTALLADTESSSVHKPVADASKITRLMPSMETSAGKAEVGARTISGFQTATFHSDDIGLNINEIRPVQIFSTIGASDPIAETRIVDLHRIASQDHLKSSNQLKLKRIEQAKTKTTRLDKASSVKPMRLSALPGPMTRSSWRHIGDMPIVSPKAETTASANGVSSLIRSITRKDADVLISPPSTESTPIALKSDSKKELNVVAVTPVKADRQAAVIPTPTLGFDSPQLVASSSIAEIVPLEAQSTRSAARSGSMQNIKAIASTQPTEERFVPLSPEAVSSIDALDKPAVPKREAESKNRIAAQRSKLPHPISIRLPGSTTGPVLNHQTLVSTISRASSPAQRRNISTEKHTQELRLTAISFNELEPSQLGISGIDYAVLSETELFQLPITITQIDPLKESNEATKPAVGPISSKPFEADEFNDFTGSAITKMTYPPAATGLGQIPGIVMTHATLASNEAVSDLSPPSLRPLRIDHTNEPTVVTTLAAIGKPNLEDSTPAPQIRSIHSPSQRVGPRYNLAAAQVRPVIAPKDEATVSDTQSSSLKVAKINTDIIVPAAPRLPDGATLAEIYIAHASVSETSTAPLASLKAGIATPTHKSLNPAVQRSNIARQLPSSPESGILSSLGKNHASKEPNLAVADLSRLDQLTRSDRGSDYPTAEIPKASGDATYDYFMDLPLDDFAIQLKADKTLGGILSFASSVDLAEPMVLKVQPLKKPLFVLVLDTFDDIQLASDAKQSWMAQFDNGVEPWIRTVGSLQKSMQPIGPMD